MRTLELLAFLTLTTCACHPKPAVLTEKGNQTMQPLTMATRCVGRYLLDVPAQMILNSQGGQEIEGVSIDVEMMTEATFESLLTTRKRELENIFLPGKERFAFLKTAHPLPENLKGIVFDRAQSEAASSRMGRVLEVLAWRAGYRVRATTKAIDTGFPEFANDAWIKESKTTTAEKLALLLSVVGRTSGRADSELPAGQGLCILNGFVSGPPTNAEEVTVFYHLESANDVFFRVNTISAFLRSETLVERGKKVEPILAQGDGKILRRARREVAGASEGEEFLYKMLDDPDSDGHQVMAHKFVFEANSKIGSAKTPLISIEFDNGTLKPMPEQELKSASRPAIKNATLSEAEALALWDAVIPTIRPRPGAF